MSMLLDEAEQPDAEDWNVPEGFELVDGRLVEMPMGAESGLVAGKLYLKLAAHCEAYPVGLALPGDIGFRCFPHRRRLLRKPDGSFIRRDRLVNNRVPSGDISIAPDLAVEAVSPNDIAESVQEKVLDYLRAGVRLGWVIYPLSRTAVAYSPGGAGRWIDETGELDGGDVVTGFRCQLRDILQPPEPGAVIDGVPPLTE
jgi:Uma2 family endonuclease